MGRRLGHSMTSVSNVTNDLIPDAPSVRDIGSAAFPFNNLYADNVDFTGSLTVSGDIIFDTALTGVAENTGTVAALGTTQANGAAIATTVALVSAADGVKGVVLPTLASIPVGMSIKIINSSATASLKVYGFGALELINTIAGTTAFIVAGGTEVVFTKYNATNWYSDSPAVFGTAQIATLAALGATQADAAPVVSQKARVTGANGTVGVKLPALASVPVGYQIKVINSSVASALNVYSDAVGELISGQAGTTAISLAAKLVLTVTKFDATNWYAEKSVLPY